MKFTISRTSKPNPSDPSTPPIEGAEWSGEAWTIEVKDLDDLVSLSRRSEQALIVSDSGDDAAPGIEIYDDFRE